MDETIVASLIAAGREALELWERAGVQRRLRVIQDAAHTLLEAREQFFECLLVDGLSIAQARYWGQWVSHRVDPKLFEAYARALVQRVDTPNGAEILVRRPDGVVFLNTPANAPTFNALSLFSILLPGNAVIVRSPEGNRGSSFLINDILRPALRRGGFSEGLVSLVRGKTREILPLFYRERGVDTIIFFGNSPAGYEVAEQGQRYGKKVILELEGNDQMVIWCDAPLEPVVDDACRAFDASTQLCLVPKHFLVHQVIFEPFVERLLARVGCLKTVAADPQEGVLAPVARAEGYFGALEALRPSGAVRCGGYRMNQEGSPDPVGSFLAPTVATLLAKDLRREPLQYLNEEVFFPLVTVIAFEGTDIEIARAMSDMMRQSAFGLRASIWTHVPAIIEHFTREVGAVGLLFFNEEHGRPPSYASPWGGTRRSGGPYGENHFFWERTSHRQSIVCSRMTEEEIQSILTALGSLPSERSIGEA